MFAALSRLLHRKTFSLHYIPEVDGIRFLAISMVFLHHSFTVFSTLWGAEPVQRNATDILMYNGYKGVHIFFVLSGFILALPFIKWRNGSGKKVLVSNFYLRRLVRLEPPYIISLLICLCMQWDAAHGAELLKHLLASVFYSHNIIYGRWGNLNGVAWTLEIEAQFYLLAPLIFQLFRLRKILRRALLAGLAVAFSAAQYLYAPATLSLYLFIPYFLLGALIADWYADGNIAALNWNWTPVIAIILYVLIWVLPINQSRLALLPFPFIVGAFLLCVFNNETLRKLFSIKALTIIGGMCYSIYLLHNPLLYVIGNITKRLYHGHSYWKNFALQLPFLRRVCAHSLFALFYNNREAVYAIPQRRKVPCGEMMDAMNCTRINARPCYREMLRLRKAFAQHDEGVCGGDVLTYYVNAPSS